MRPARALIDLQALRHNYRLARDLGVEMPISAAVAAVLDGRMGAAEAVDRLMARDPKEELA